MQVCDRFFFFITKTVIKILKIKVRYYVSILIVICMTPFLSSFNERFENLKGAPPKCNLNPGLLVYALCGTCVSGWLGQAKSMNNINNEHQVRTLQSTFYFADVAGFRHTVIPRRFTRSDVQERGPNPIRRDRCVADRAEKYLRVQMLDQVFVQVAFDELVADQYFFVMTLERKLNVSLSLSLSLNYRVVFFIIIIICN